MPVGVVDPEQHPTHRGPLHLRVGLPRREKRAASASIASWQGTPIEKQSNPAAAAAFLGLRRSARSGPPFV